MIEAKHNLFGEQFISNGNFPQFYKIKMDLSYMVSYEIKYHPTLNSLQQMFSDRLYISLCKEAHK